MRFAIFLLLVALCSVGCKRTHMGFTPSELAATQKARDSLTNFLSALEGSKTNLSFPQVCAVGTLRPGGPAELVWFNVAHYDGTLFYGMATEAHPAVGVTNGQRVRIPATELVDWSYLSRTGIVGRFLDRAVR